MNWEKLGSMLDTAQDQHFKIQILNLSMNWKKLCPNLSFTVEKRWEIDIRKGLLKSHFELNINDSDIPFSKILRIYQ